MATQHSRLIGFIRRPEAGVMVAFVAVYLFFAYFTRGVGFVSWAGTASWLNVSAQLGIVAVAVCALLIAGEFDLSIGSVVGFSSVTAAIGTNTFGLSIWVMIPLILGFALLVGYANGKIVTRTGLPSFIVTLATLFILAGAGLGLSRLLAGTTSVSVKADDLARLMLAGKFGPASVSILWWIGITLVFHFILTRTAFGNWVFATGGNIEAAKGAGVPTDRVKIRLFMATAFCAALVGIMQAIEFRVGNAANGQGYVFQAAIVSVVGGALITGGYGSAFGVALGAAIFGVISIAIFYTGWNTDWVQLFLGVLLLCAVLANNYFRKLALTRTD